MKFTTYSHSNSKLKNCFASFFWDVDSPRQVCWFVYKHILTLWNLDSSDGILLAIILTTSSCNVDISWT